MQAGCSEPALDPAGCLEAVGLGTDRRQGVSKLQLGAEAGLGVHGDEPPGARVEGNRG